MNKCPFCNGNLIAIPSRIENRYAGGCDNKDCPVIFRTKHLSNKLEVCMEINDIIKGLYKK